MPLQVRCITPGSVSLTLRYLYDESRSPVGFGLKYPTETGWTNYYFAKNLQGDVTAIYRSDASGGSYTGTLVAKYAYDPYGQVLTMVNGEGADSLIRRVVEQVTVILEDQIEVRFVGGPLKVRQI